MSCCFCLENATSKCMLCGKPMCEHHKIIKMKAVLCVECAMWKPNVYYGCGLLPMVDSIASHEALQNIPNWLPQNYDKSDKAFQHAIFNIEWVKMLESETIPDLNNQIKQNIIELMENMQNELWLNWLRNFDKICLDYWIQEKEDSPNGLKVRDYDNFFREESQKRNLPIPRFMLENPIDRANKKQETRKPIPIDRAVCPRCGSSHTINHSPSRILCHDCGKTSMKAHVKEYVKETIEPY